ncbi:Bcr/CflA family efflux MFS transporter [Novosphingobium piscinae]|uniref:Bcr/CflA family efflux transporter n=1 Tax=Novosphingobium piscinae TaxID=1507448 RepID=A0A7X1KQK0_9SPHN|nr:Bcr/CflA family efflux MFS transporter [Novosphingobium piscinae]MBC2669821.1 Bcr/CflA family efflux MFS transporter [Novosphingobium piscinae]
MTLRGLLLPRAATPARRPGSGVVLALAGLAALGSLATQLVVPALPPIAHAFAASPAAVQKVIGVYLLGLAIGQFVAGPLSDRAGRRPVLLGGLALFVCGSLAAALAPALPLLLAARLVQALGGACGIVVARVMVGDLFPPDEVAARQATLMSVVLISPAVAPVIGGLIAEAAGWRAVFGLLTLTGALVALAALGRLGETRRTPAAPGPGLLAAWRELAGLPRFTGHALAIACGSAALYTFLAAAPFLLARDHGLGPRDTGLLLLLIAASSIVGTRCVRRLNRTGRGAVRGAAWAAGGAMLLVVFAVAGWHQLAAFVGPMVLIGFGTGVLGPTGIAQVIVARPGLEGTASSLAGAGQMLASALASSLIGAADTLHLGTVVLSLAALALVFAAYGRRPA